MSRTITLDTCVIKISCNYDDDLWPTATELLMHILRICHRIALDTNSQILSEYSKHMKNALIFKKFFKSMGQRGKVKFFYIDDSPINIDIEIDEDDKKFIKVALRTNDKIIVSEDSDFLDGQVKEMLKNRFGITILSITEALEFISNFSNL